MSGMEVAEHIAALQRDGELLAAAAQRAGLDACVPSCPPWRVRDLLRHIGYVHRWAASFVVEELARPLPGRPGEAELLRGGPADGELLSWFTVGHAGLVSALRAADPGLSCWTFLEAPSPLAFWARRQAHETAIHRVDAELAGGVPGPFPADFAADGVDELIMGFFGRDTEELTPVQRASCRQRVGVRAADTGGSWLVELTEDGKLAASVRRAEGLTADEGVSGESWCELTGPAAGLYLLLWNRADPAAAGVTVSGDEAVLRAWSAGMRVTWQ
jgi:uncharacterized protein (TIGR03083 family)